MNKSGIRAVMLMLAIAVASSLPAEDADGKSRLKLEPAAEVPGHNAIADPYDDLGDFVATYTVRRRRQFGDPPGQDVNWGYYQARRRGDWMSLSYDLEQPEPVPEGGMAMIKERETWIWYRNRFEGVLNNNILTLDPSDSPPDGPLPPLTVGMGWRYDYSSESRPVLAPPGANEEARRASLGWGPSTITDRGDGTVEEFSMMPEPWETLSDGTRIHRYTRYIRASGQMADQARAFRVCESGMRVMPPETTGAFDLPLLKVEVAAWKGKFPAEFRYTSYSLPEPTENSRQALYARLSRLGSIDTILSEYHFVLTDVRSPIPGDLIEMNDFRPRIAAIRDGRHDAAVEDVTDPAPDGTEVTKWTLDENSQMWSRVAAP